GDQRATRMAASQQGPSSPPIPTPLRLLGGSGLGLGGEVGRRPLTRGGGIALTPALDHLDLRCFTGGGVTDGMGPHEGVFGAFPRDAAGEGTDRLVFRRAGGHGGERFAGGGRVRTAPFAED